MDRREYAKVVSELGIRDAIVEGSNSLAVPDFSSYSMRSVADTLGPIQTRYALPVVGSNEGSDSRYHSAVFILKLFAYTFKVCFHRNPNRIIWC